MIIIAANGWRNDRSGAKGIAAFSTSPPSRRKAWRNDRSGAKGIAAGSCRWWFEQPDHGATIEVARKALRLRDVPAVAAMFLGATIKVARKALRLVS